MTKAESLRALIEKVESGTLVWPEAQAWGHHGCEGRSSNVWSAFHGSLDAAKALHEALLPGWWFTITEGGSNVREVNQDNEHVFGVHRSFGSDNDSPARAWLLAILKAKLTEVEE